MKDYGHVGNMGWQLIPSITCAVTARPSVDSKFFEKFVAIISETLLFVVNATPLLLCFKEIAGLRRWLSCKWYNDADEKTLYINFIVKILGVSFNSLNPGSLGLCKPRASRTFPAYQFWMNVYERCWEEVAAKCRTRWCNTVPYQNL